MRKLLAAALAAVSMIGAALAEDTPAPRPPIRIDPAALDSLRFDDLTPCNGDRGWTPNFVFAPERRAIAVVPGVSRHGRTLRVGRARFVDAPFNDDTGAGAGYGFVGRYRSTPLAVTTVAYFEGGGFQVVDPKTGSSAATAWIPLPAPDGHTLAAADRSDGYSDPGIELVEWRGGKVTETAFDANYPCALRWVSAGELDFQVSTDPPDAPLTHWAAASLRREDGRWVLHAPPGGAP